MYQINEVKKEYANHADAVANDLLHDAWHWLEHEVCIGTYRTKEEALKVYRKLMPKVRRIGNAYVRTDYELLCTEAQSDGCRVRYSTASIEVYEDEE